MDFKNGKAAFIMPHWADNGSLSRKHLDNAIEGIFNQTDGNNNLVIIDDFSPSGEVRQYLKKLGKTYPGKINVILENSNQGPGFCRNIGIQWALNQGSPFVLFNDADDISHPRRVEQVRQAFVEDPEVTVVYTTFAVIDENSRKFPEEKLSPSIVEILEGHRNGPPQGKNVWIDIGTKTGYINLTSATAAHTRLASRFPFPRERVSEDWHTWVRYSAAGGKFRYLPGIPTSYRIPMHSAGSATRSRIGGKNNFYRLMTKNSTDGFKQALAIALENKTLQSQQTPELMVRFYIKLAETMAREHMYQIAMEQVSLAAAISKEQTNALIREKGLQPETWTKLSDRMINMEKTYQNIIKEAV
jgi:glycosyltransferase involved in cell wall biosynthesis